MLREMLVNKGRGKLITNVCRTGLLARKALTEQGSQTQMERRVPEMRPLGAKVRTCPRNYSSYALE